MVTLYNNKIIMQMFNILQKFYSGTTLDYFLFLRAVHSSSCYVYYRNKPNKLLNSCGLRRILILSMFNDNFLLAAVNTKLYQQKIKTMHRLY